MSLYKQWDKKAYQIETQAEYDKFWGDYLPKETKIYEYLLENKEQVIEESILELSKRFDLEPLVIVGFLDGVNTSLVDAIDIESVEENTVVKLELDFKKLYFNMLEAKAEWLYTLPQWDTILTAEERKEIKKEYNQTKTFVNENKIGRNDPCICGSGKKYKKCCGKEK